MDGTVNGTIDVVLPATSPGSIADPNAMPWPAGMPTLEDARAAVRSRPGITKKRRDDILASLKKFEIICRHVDRQRRAEVPRGARLAADDGILPSIFMTFEYAGPRLAAASPAMLGVTAGRLSNIRSDVRGEIRNLGQIDPDATLSPAWEACRALLESKFRRISLTAGARFFTAQKIEPAAVTSQAVKQWETSRPANTLAKNPVAAVYSFVDTSNFAHDNIPGWPIPRLVRENARKTYTFPIETFPQSLQDDLDRFECRITGADDDEFFDDDEDFFGDAPSAPRKAARPSTVATRRYQARLALAALVHAGRRPESLTSLRDLVEPLANARTILAFFRKRTGKKPSSQNAGIAEFLRQVSKYHHPQSATTTAKIRKWGRKMAPKHGRGMTPKNRHRLRALTDLRTRARLLYLPFHLMQLAAVALRANQPKRAAMLAMQAVIFEILLICPLRLQNVAGLELLRHFQYVGPKGGHIAYLVILEDEVKNDVPVYWPIPAESAVLIQTFIDRYRKHLGDAESVFLFPGQKVGARSKATIRRIIGKAAHEHLGVALNPHLMRAYAAWSYLKEHPGEYETIRRILGHKDISTTVAYYTGIEDEFAALKFDATVLRARRETRSLAMAEFRTKRPKPPKSPPPEEES